MRGQQSFDPRILRAVKESGGERARAQIIGSYQAALQRFLGDDLVEISDAGDKWTVRLQSCGDLTAEISLPEPGRNDPSSAFIRGGDGVRLRFRDDGELFLADVAINYPGERSLVFTGFEEAMAGRDSRVKMMVREDAPDKSPRVLLSVTPGAKNSWEITSPVGLFDGGSVRYYLAQNCRAEYSVTKSDSKTNNRPKGRPSPPVLTRVKPYCDRLLLADKTGGIELNLTIGEGETAGVAISVLKVDGEKVIHRPFFHLSFHPLLLGVAEAVSSALFMPEKLKEMLRFPGEGS